MDKTNIDLLRSNWQLLYSLISRHARLKRKGRCWKCLCPFHSENTPSFTLYEDCHFHCFGCGVNGDVFDFLQKIKGITFEEAFEELSLGTATSPAQPKSNGGQNGDWQPLIPVPADAPKPTEAQIRCDMLHEYCDSEDRPLCYVRRHERKGTAGKQFYPLTYGRLNGKLGWHGKAPLAPRPLYGLNRLPRAAPNATALLCEGEKSADAAQRMLPDMVCLSWMGGAGAADHADLRPLAGRPVVLWPDADGPGRKAAASLAARLQNATIANTDDLAGGFDAADLEASGIEDPAAWLNARMPARRDDAPQPAQDLTPKPWTYCDPTQIRPREWLLGTTLLRGYATVLASMGGVGKTAHAIAMALAFITGRRDILDQHVFKIGKVWFLTLEDDREELGRRIAAAMIAHAIQAEQVEGRLFINAASERPLLLARADAAGSFVVCEDVGLLVDGINSLGIGLVIIDPLIKSHAVVENSNEHMDRLIGTANTIAAQTRSAVLLAAHFRKGSGEEGAREAIRGGSALIDGARIVRTLTPMTPKEAESLKIAPEEAFRHIRVQDAKANLAPTDHAAWFRLESVALGNSNVDAAYPAGDHVQAARAWKPPTAFDGMDQSAIERIVNRLRREPEAGWFYSPEPRAKFWAGTVIVEEACKSKEQAGRALQLWLKNGVLSAVACKTPSRNVGTRVVVNDEQVAEILGELRSFDRTCRERVRR
jgi:hypothetical protein